MAIKNRKHPLKLNALFLATAAFSCSQAFAHPGAAIAGNVDAINADSHAPIGVMGDHMHKAGEWMLSYRYMEMEMDGNLNGDDSITPTEIVNTLANPFAGPANVRVVPINMTTKMHMIGLMYAPTDNLTLMAMVNHTTKEMDHITFQGGMGTTELGRFTTKASGIGDTKIAGLYRLFDDPTHHVHLNVGFSLPTGSIKETDDVLSPMNTRPNLRLPYPMQLGTGTFDFEPGLTYTGKRNQWAWGAQYKAMIRLSENSQDYTFGDAHQISSWASYSYSPSISFSARLTGKTVDGIDGQDDNITAPVQTANPNNQGGDYVNLGFGFNSVFQEGWLRGHRIALEYSMPIMQDVNGIQLEMENMLTFGYQYAF